MTHYPQKSASFRRAVSVFIAAAFLLNTVVPVYAQNAFVLPVPGEMVHLSAAFTPPLLKAVKVNPDNPFAFNFIVDIGSSKLENSELQMESNKLIRYFLASLTTPEDDLWVNLSPYEKDRVVPNSFGVTEMGRDLLAQDYLLKQVTSTLMYPEEELGKKFWDTVYQKAYEKFGTTNIMANTFNKVWIVPEKAVVYENGMTAFVSETKLKVMLEEDYKAMEKSMANPAAPVIPDVNNIGSQVVRDIIIPELEREVNSGKNFASLRQVYNSLILANWYKKRLKDSILTKVYVDKNKVAGVDIEDKAEAQKIYEQYIAAFKKGVYNYIKEDVDPVSKEPTPRKYFSGGMNLKLNISSAVQTRRGMPPEATRASSSLIEVDAKFDLSSKGQQTRAFEGGEVRSASSALTNVRKGLAALALGTMLALTPVQTGAAAPSVANDGTVSVSPQSIGKYLLEFKQAQSLVDAGKFSEAQTALALINEDLQARVASLKGGGFENSESRRELVALAREVKTAIRELNFLIRDNDRKITAEFRDAAKQEEQKSFSGIVDYYLAAVKNLGGQLNGFTQSLNGQDLSQSQKLLAAVRADWLKAAGRLKGLLEVTKGSSDYRPARAAEFEKNIGEFGVDIVNYEQYLRLIRSFRDLSSGIASDQVRLERLRLIRAEALSLANDGEIRKETRDIYQRLVTDIDGILSKVLPQTASSSLAKNEYDPVILEDIKNRYDLVGWDDTLLDWQMFSTKKNAAGKHLLNSLMNRPERNMTGRYRELLQEINGIRSVVVSGGFLTDDQISYLRAAETHFRLVDRLFTEDERKSNNFPTSDFNEALKVLQVTGLKELLDLLEFVTLNALVERLADDIPQGWRKLEVLKVLYGGETVNMELARYKARLDILLKERKDGPPGGAIASSAVWDNSALSKLELSSLDAEMQLVGQRTSEQWREEGQLKNQALAIGHKLEMMAHGVSDSDWLDPYRAFMNIVLEERLPNVSGYFNMAAFSDRSFFGGRGEYFAVLNPGKYKTSGGTIESPQDSSDFLLFLFPNDEARGLALQILWKAEEQGIITQQQQQTIRFKLVTYKEFVNRYSVVVEEQEAQRAAAELTAAKVKAALLDIGVPGFSVAMINDPVFGLSTQEKDFALKAAGEIAVSLGKSDFNAFGDKNVLIALKPFFARFSSTYNEDQVGEALNDVVAKMSAGLKKEGAAQKYQAQIARVFAAYYYKNYHLPVTKDIEIEPDADLQAEFNAGRTSLFNVATIAILGAGLKGFVAITRYPDRRVLIADENPFVAAAFKEYQALTGKQDLQILEGEMIQPDFGYKVTERYDKVLVPELFNVDLSQEERRVILQNAAAILYPGNSLQIYETFNTDNPKIAEQAKDEVEEILRSAGLVVRMAHLMRVSGDSLLMQVSAVHASSAVATNSFSETASSSLVPSAIQEEMAVRDQIAKAMISRFGLDLNRYAGGAQGLYQYSKILAHRMDIPEQGLGDQVFLPRFIDDVFARAKEIGGATTAKIVFLEAGARPLYDAANLMARISNAYPVDSLKDVWATMGNYREMKADPEQAVLFIKYLVDQGVISGQSGQPQKLLFVDTDTGFSDLGTALIFTKTLLDPDVIKKANERFGLSIQPFNESPEGNTLEIMYMFSDYNVSPQKWARHIRQDKISPAVEQKLQIKGYNSQTGTSLTNYISWTWNQLDLFVKTTSIFDRFSLNSRTGRVSVRRKDPYNQAYLDLDKLKVARALQDAGLLMGVLDVMQTRGYDVTAEAEKLMRNLQGALSISGLSQPSSSASSALEFNRENVAARVDRLKNIFKTYDRGILDYIKGGVAQIAFLSRKVVHRMDDPIGLNDQVFLPKFIEAVFDKAGKLGKPEETKIVFLEAGAKPLYDAARLTNQFAQQYPADQLKSVWATMGNYEAMQDDPEQGVLFIKYLVDQGVLTPETKNLLIVDTDIGVDNLGTALVFTKSLLDPETLRKANERFGLNIAPFNEGGNNLEFLYMYSDYVSNPKKWDAHIKLDGISPAMEKKLRVASYNVSGEATLTNYIADWWSAVDSFVKTGSISRRFSLDAATGKAVVTEQAPYQQDSEDIRVLKLARAVEDTTLALSVLDVLEARGYDVTQEAEKYFQGLEDAFINSGLVGEAASSSLIVGSAAQPDINKVEARHGRVQRVIQKYDDGILDHIDTTAGLYARGASVVHTVDNPIPLFDDQVFLPKFLDAAFDKAKSFGDKAATKMVFLEAGARPLYDAAQLMAEAAGDFPVDNLKSIWATMGNYLAIRSDREQAILFIKFLVDQGVLTPETKHLLIVDTDTGQMSRNPRLHDSPIGTALIFAKTLLVEDIVAEANQRYGFNIQPFNAGEGGNTLDILYMYSDYNATTTAQAKQQRWDDHVRVSQISPEIAERLHLEGFNQGVADGITNYIGDLWFPVDNFTKTENIADQFSVDAATGKVVVTPAALYDQASDDVRELKLARAIEDTGLRIAMLDVLEARGYNVETQEEGVLKDLEDAYKNSGLLDDGQGEDASSPLTPGGIDLKSDKLNLDIRGNPSPIRFNFDTQQLQNLQFDGLVPVIINMTPVVNLPMFLSANSVSDDQNS